MTPRIPSESSPQYPVLLSIRFLICLPLKYENTALIACMNHSDPQWLNHFELLVRSILIRPEAPAVIILGHFAPQIQAQNGFAGPELLHTVVAQFYDVPHIR